MANILSTTRLLSPGQTNWSPGFPWLEPSAWNDPAVHMSPVGAAFQPTIGAPDIGVYGVNYGTISRVQGNSNSADASSTTIAVTLSAVGNGNDIVGAVSWNNGSGQTLLSVSDNQGNSYSVANTITNSSLTSTTASFSLFNITNAPTTITATFSAGATFLAIVAEEYSGAAGTDGNRGNAQSSSTTATDWVTSGSITTTNNNDIIWGVTFTNGGFPTPGTGFTSRIINGVAINEVFTEDRTQSSAGSIAATFTTSAGDSLTTLVIALRPSATYLLASDDLTIGSPIIGTSDLGEPGGGTNSLTSTSFTTSPPSIGTCVAYDGVTITHTNGDKGVAGGGLNSATITGLNVGNAFTGRVVLSIIVASNGGGYVQLTSASIGGVAATLAGTTTTGYMFASAVVPTGTSVDVVVNGPTINDAHVAATFVLGNAASAAYIDTYIGNAPASIDVKAGGLVVALTNSLVSWTGATALPPTNPKCASFSNDTGSDITNRTISTGDTQPIVVVAFNKNIGSASLTSTSFVDGSPVFGSSTLGQTHGLSTANLTTASPIFGASTLNQAHSLSATSLVTTSPVIGTGTVTQTSVLSATNFATSSPTINPANITQTHVLSGSSLSIPPVFGSAALNQTHVLNAATFTDTSPVFGSSSLTQKQVFTGTNFTTSSPTFGTPTLTQANAVTASNFTDSSPVFGDSTLGQTHVLSGSNFSASPVFGSSTLNQTHILASTSFVDSSPVFGASVFGQIHIFASVSIIDTSPIFGSSTLGQSNVLGSSSFTDSTPVFGASTLTQKHGLSSSNFASAAPVFGSSTLTQTHILGSTNYSSGLPVFGSATIGQSNILTGTSFTNTSPVFGAATLSAFAGLSNLTSTAFSATSPIIGTATFTQGQNLSASGMTLSVSFTSSNITQTHNLSPSGLTIAPLFGSSTITQTHVLSSTNFVDSAPVFGAVTIFQGGTINPVNLTITPVFGSATLTQTHILGTSNLATSTPIIGSSTPSQTHVIGSASLTTSISIGSSTLGQTHKLTSSNYVNGSPIEGTPTLYQANAITSASVGISSPSIPTATVGQTHNFSAAKLDASAVSITPASINQVAVLSAGNTVTDSTKVDAATLGQKHNLTSASNVGSISIGLPALAFLQSLLPDSLATTSPICGKPFVGQGLPSVFKHIIIEGMKKASYADGAKATNPVTCFKEMIPSISGKNEPSMVSGRKSKYIIRGNL